MKLRGQSFHSVKGGVGKSTLAVMAALRCARNHRPVYLIDMDLTGTSLADVLPLCAPRWEGDVAVNATLFASRPPDGGFHDAGETRDRIEQRHRETSARRDSLPDDLRVPFLNDYLLHDPPDASRADPDPRSFAWQLTPAYPKLFVIPSSAAPGDLDRIVPVIFDEQHAALLESRLERLLAALLTNHEDDGEVTFVVDVPPTIPGLSRSVISLGLRLSADPKQALAEKGKVPPALDAAEVSWTVHMVTTPDPQDLRATERWFGLVQPEERRHFRLVVNREFWGDTVGARQAGIAVQLGLRSAGDAAPDPTISVGWLDDYIDDALWVKHNRGYGFFLDRGLPDDSALHDLFGASE